MPGMLHIILPAAAGNLAPVLALPSMVSLTLPGTGFAVAGMMMVLGCWTAATTRSLVTGLINANVSVWRLLAQSFNIAAIMIIIIIAPDEFLIGLMAFATVFYILLEVLLRHPATVARHGHLEPARIRARHSSR